MFTEIEKQLLQDALDMALTSNKRMQNSKPRFEDIFKKIEQEILELKAKVGAIKNK